MYGDESASESEYPLINIITSKWYFDYTGDSAFVAQVYDSYKALLEKWLNSRDKQGFFDCRTPYIEISGMDKTLRLTAVHALMARCFVIMGGFAEILNKGNDAAFFKRQAAQLSDLVQSDFWDDSKQLFNDGFKNGRLTGDYYPTSNVWPLLYDCTDTAQTERILAYLKEQLKDIGEDSRTRRITAYGSFYALAALYKQGRADIAERFIRKYWTRMILNGDDTSWEYFGKRGEEAGGGQGTASHAWSGHPAYFLSTEALGVSLGFQKNFSRDTILIAPQSATLTWARGIVPHPLGPVEVEWKIEGDNLFLNYNVAKGVKVKVKPQGRLVRKILWVNGRRINPSIE